MAATKATDDETDGDKFVKRKTSTPNWGSDAKNGTHLWSRTGISGDFCSIGNSECADRGPRIRCAACKVIVHTECLKILIGKEKLLCRKTFQDSQDESYREKTDIPHHWIARKNAKGKCRMCSKNFGGKVISLLSETIGCTCSWCKEVCHNKESCYNQNKAQTENCSLGQHSRLLVPPTWIVKLQETENSKTSFSIKPIPSSNSMPLLVFINPKSGGNQGSRLLNTFQWLLNPRQVFDLCEGGPNLGLEMYKRVPDLRILACGGDGTVGWILSVLDNLKLCTSIPIAVLPLGTGNDLARALGWGGGYTDEPISKILNNVEEGEIVKLDRWILNVTPNKKADSNNNKEAGRKNLPLTVVNNYFSIGVDATIALEFHEAREANPKKFNSRIRNKMFYGQAGGKDLILRKWKDLSSFVTLECDGKDMTGKLKELKVHAILFLNISSYGGGTRPWGASGHNNFKVPTTDDGLIEVIGLTTYQLPLLQAGGHGSPIAQCKKAKLITSCTIPVQVDGEPCRLSPSIIDIDLLNTVNMIARTKKNGAGTRKLSVEKFTLPLKLISLKKYEAEHNKKAPLKDKASGFGTVTVSYNTELTEIRPEINKQLEEKEKKKLQRIQVPGSTRRSSKIANWWFLDSCSGTKFFRIDEAQEHLFYVSDICDEELYILEQRESTDDDAKSNSTRAGHEDDVSRLSSSSSGQGSGDDRSIAIAEVERIPEPATVPASPVASGARSPSRSTAGSLAQSPSRSQAPSPRSPGPSTKRSPAPSPSPSPVRAPAPSPARSSGPSTKRSPAPSPVRSPAPSPAKSTARSPVQSPIRAPAPSPAQSPPRSQVSASARSPVQSPPRSPAQSPPRSQAQSPPRSQVQSPPRSQAQSPPRSQVSASSRSPVQSPPRSPAQSPPRSQAQSPPRSQDSASVRSPAQSPPRSQSPSSGRSPVVSPTRSDGPPSGASKVHSLVRPRVLAQIIITKPDMSDNESDIDRLSVPGSKRASITSLTPDPSEMDLITAAKFGYLNRVAELHTAGSSLGEKDKEGRTALHHAAFLGNIDVVRYLAVYSALSVLDAQDDIMYHTALHRAALRGDRIICSILVSAGASVDQKDKQGQTAQDLANAVGDKKLADFLESVSELVIL